MNSLNYISDEEFLPFLQILGVESDRKSFEWMFNDPEFSDVLRWLYNSLDHNNSLTAREKYRYAEIEEKGLLSSEDLDANISSLKEEFEGICLPGDQVSMDDAKLDVQMQMEKLKLLEKQESVIKDLIKENDLAKEELNREQTKLNSAHHQLALDEASSGEECITLAGDVETITDDVIDVIADTLSLYSDAHSDKDIARKFLAFGSFDSYRQSQALFRSHFDLYVSRKFNKKHDDSITDRDLREAVLEANVMGERLCDAALAYVDAKAELAGEQAKLALVANYTSVHPSRVAQLSVAAQAALEQEQEEGILARQLRLAARQLADQRGRRACEAAAGEALAGRERIHTDLSHLLETSTEALNLDKALYNCLRQALRTAQDTIQLSTQLRDHIVAESAASSERIKSMNDIFSEQESCDDRLQSSDPLLETLFSILGVESNNDVLYLMKLFADLQGDAQELKDNLYDSYERREEALVAFQKTTQPLHDYIYDGCTKLANCWDRGVASMCHSLRQQLSRVETQVTDASVLFTSVKNGDKQGLRKLWQLFLTDQNKLQAAMKAAQSRSYS